MRVIKLGAISFVFLFLLITAISLLLPSSIIISRAIDIHVPLDSVYDKINNLTKWKDWYANYDSTQVIFANIKIGEGALMTMNKTTVSIIQSTKGKVKTVWKSGSKSLQAEFNFFSHKNSDQVTVQWNFTQQVKWYPWEKFALIVSDKTIAPVMEKSLDNLKKSVENG